MTVATKFFDWTRSGLDWDRDPYEDMAPALVRLFEYLEDRWGGYGYGLDDYDRPIRGGTRPSTHAYGRALDYRWKSHPDVTARAFTNRETLDGEIIPFLIANSAELGIQHIMAEDRSWLPPAHRDARGQRHDDGWISYSNTYDGWIHIEVHPDHDMDDRSVEVKLSPMPPPAPPQDPGPKGPIFDPVAGKFGLWPIAPKQLTVLGAKGDPVRYLQGVIFHRAGGNISIDGHFGTQTHARVEDLQRFFGLAVDGRVGTKQTWPIIDFLADL